MKFDLLIKNGQVFQAEGGEPKICDVAVNGSVIAAVGDLSRDEAAVTIDAAGCLVTPGLIDEHLHLYTKGSDEGIPADLTLLPNGITSAIDGGTAGVSTFESFYAINLQNSMASLKSFINVSSLGMLSCRTFENTKTADYEEERLLAMAKKYPDRILALKLRYSLDLNPAIDTECLDRCLAIAEKMGLPLVVHITNPPVDMAQIASRLRPGDVFCHCFQGKGHTILDEQGRVLKEVREAQKRGVLFDASNGTNNYSHRIARAALAEGFFPDFISTDCSNVFHSYYKPKCFALPYIMSKYLALGMSLEDVIRRVTADAAAFGKWEKKGHLIPGYDADIAIFKLAQQPVTFKDFADNEIEGSALLSPQLTIKDGVIVYRNMLLTD